MYLHLRISLAIILAFSLSGDPVWAAPDRIITTRFSGVTGGNTPSMTAYVQGEKGWQPVSSAVGDSAIFHERSDLGGSCIRSALKTIGHQAQAFAMNKYVQTDFFSIGDVHNYLHGSGKFMDRPVTYLHYVSDTPTPDGMSGILSSEHQMKMGFADKTVPVDGYVRGSFNIVSGQKVVPGSSIYPTSMPLELPWTTDPEFVQLARQSFSRVKYPLVWEVGRAAKTDAGEFGELMGLAGAEMLRQTLHFGTPQAGMVDKAFVTFHTLTKTNTDKMEKLFPKGVFLRSNGDPNNAVFLVSLNEYLTKSPVHKFSAAHRTFQEQVGRAHTAVEVQSFIETAKYAQSVPLDFRYRGKFTGKPLLFNAKLSQTDGVPIQLLASKFGITSSEMGKLQQANFSEKITDIADPFWPGLIVDPATPYSIPKAEMFRAFQISNLDPILAASDPQYAKAALVAGFDHFFSLFGSGQPLRHSPEVGLLANELRANNLRFMLTTHYPDTAEALSKLGAEQSKKFPLATEKHSKVYWDELKKHSGTARPSDSQSVFVFSIDQVLKFRDDLYREAASNSDLIPRATPGVFWWLHGTTAP